jgi:hypothetical protein
MLQNINDEKYRVTLKIKHGLLTQVLDWCNKNCTGDWSFMDSSDLYSDFINSWCFIFKSKQDFVMFTLKWQ